MKILIYTHEFPPFLGGLATTSHKLATGISEAGLEVTVLAPRYSKKFKELDIEYKFQVKRMIGLSRNHGIPIPIPEIAGLYSLYKAIPKIKPDVLLLITREGHTAGGLLLDYPFKVIVRVAGYEAYRYLLGKKPLNRLLSIPIRRLYVNASKIITPSRSTQELLEMAGIPVKKIRIIYNGANNEMISRKPDHAALEELKRRFNIKKCEKLILSVSRLVRGKGQDVVIRALPRIIKEYGDVKYLIVGEGRYERELKKLADREGVRSRIIFAGPVPNNEVIHYYDLCYLFIMPNFSVKGDEHIEGLPNVIFESMSRQKPVITGIPGGAKELVENGVNGYVEDGNNIDKISGHILELLHNEKKAKEFGEYSRRKIIEGFTEEIMIDNYLKIIQND